MTARSELSSAGKPWSQRTGTRVKKVLSTATLIATSTVALTGCLVNYDAAKPEVLLINDYNEDVVVVVEGLKPEIDTAVDAGRANVAGVNKCIGTAIRVETTSGEVLGRIEEQACPNWVLTITEAGELEYTELDN